MTQSFDELYAPKAMSLDELFAAIRPPPLLPVSYAPPDNSDFMSSSSASGVNMPQPISPDRLWAGMRPMPLAPLNVAPEDAPRQSWQSLGTSIPRLQPIAAAGPPQNANSSSATSNPPLKYWPVPDYGTLNPGNHATDEGIGTFGAPRDGGRKHEGIDIQAPVGTPVVAAGDGRVVDVNAPPNSTFGNQVVIDHGNGMFTQSAHLDMLGVRPGDVVSAGQIIGLSGRTGDVPKGARSHVHYEVRLGSKWPVRLGGKVDDPLQYLPPPP